MKKLVLLALVAVMLFPLSVLAGDMCTKIRSGEIVDDNGVVIPLGFNDMGYNYQRHLYINPNMNHVEKWNDAYLSRKDCDGDGKLDKHYGFETYRGSNAKLRTYSSGKYDSNGETCIWFLFTKIVAAPTDSDTGCSEDGFFGCCRPDGSFIGPLWGTEFAQTKYEYTDSCYE